MKAENHRVTEELITFIIPQSTLIQPSLVSSQQTQPVIMKGTMKGSVLRRAHLGVQTLTIQYLCEWKFQPAAVWVITGPTFVSGLRCWLRTITHSQHTELFIPNIKIYYHYYSPLFWGQVRVISVYRTVVCFIQYNPLHIRIQYIKFPLGQDVLYGRM